MVDVGGCRWGVWRGWGDGDGDGDGEGGMRGRMGMVEMGSRYFYNGLL